MVEFERDEQREDLAEHRLERPVVERVEHAQEQPRDHRCREPVQRHQDNERDERRQDQRHRAFEALVVRLPPSRRKCAPISRSFSSQLSVRFKLLVGLQREARRADRKEDEVGAAGVRDALPGCGRDAHHVPGRPRGLVLIHVGGWSPGGTRARAIEIWDRKFFRVRAAKCPPVAACFGVGERCFSSHWFMLAAARNLSGLMANKCY